MSAGSIEKRSEKAWYVRVYLGRDPVTGKVLRHNKLIHGTKKDAQRYLTGVLRDRDLGVYAGPSKETLAEFLARWMATKKGTVRERTLRGYQEKLGLYVLKELGAQRLDRLQPIHVQEFYSRLTKRGLAAWTVRGVHTVLHQALRAAVRWRLIPHNPAAELDLPALSKRERPVLSPEQARVFVEVALEDRFGVLLIFAVATGMRPGEFLALRWSDLDLEATPMPLAVVRRVLVDDQTAEKWYFEEPKTAGSRRTVVLPPGLVPLLKLHRRRQLEERLASGAGWKDQDLVFPGQLGAPMSRRNLARRNLRPLLKAAAAAMEARGLKGPALSMRLYDLGRHSCATLLMALGENPKVVAERLGHAGMGMTLGTYTHVLPTMQQGAALKMDEILFAAPEAPAMSER